VKYLQPLQVNTNRKMVTNDAIYLSSLCKNIMCSAYKQISDILFDVNSSFISVVRQEM